MSIPKNQYVYPNKYLQENIEQEKEELKKKNTMGMMDFSNIGDDAELYIKILFEKNQRLEKENKELRIKLRCTLKMYRAEVRTCPCGATEGGPIQGCDCCEIYKVSSGMWWSKAGWAVKDDE